MYNICRVSVIVLHVFAYMYINEKVLALARSPTSLKNVTVRAEYFSEFQCNSSLINPTDEIEWIKYDTKGNATTILRSPGWNLDPNKYETEDDYLIVMEVNATDVGTYCCNSNSSGLQCANLVVIKSLDARFPVNRTKLARGGNATFGCTVTYGSPPRSNDYIFPLSEEQVPTIEAFLGTKRLTEIIGEEEIIRNNWTVKTVVFWKKITEEDIDKDLICRVQTQVPRFDFNVTRWPEYDYRELRASVMYPGYRLTKSPDDVYYIGDRFTCLGVGATNPIVYWIDKATNQTLNQSTDSVIFVVKKLGANELICGVKHPVNDYKVETVVQFMALNGSGRKTDSLSLWLAVALPLLIIIKRPTGFDLISNVNSPMLSRTSS